MPVPMTTVSTTFLALSCLFSAGFNFVAMLLLFEFKRNPKLSMAVLLIPCLLLDGLISFLETPYTPDPTHFFNSPLYFIVYGILDISIYLAYFCYFIKGNPIRNYCIFFLATFFLWLPFMEILAIFRKAMGWTALIYASSFLEFQASLLELLAYVLAFLVLRRIHLRWGQKISRLPLLPCVIFLILDLLSYFTALIPSTEKGVSLFIGGIPATINVILLGAVFILPSAVAFILYFSISEARITGQKRNILQCEMKLQHDYYRKLQELQRPLRELRHDLANHLEIMNQVQRQNKQEALEKYEDSLLALCHTLDQQTAIPAKWSKFQLPGFSDHDAYVLYYCLIELLRKHERSWDELYFREHEGHLSISLPKKGEKNSKRSCHPFFGKGNANRGLEKELKKDIHFQLAKKLITDHKGQLLWGEDTKTWNFTLNF
ncbi:hypothetical protein LI177_08610 [bacterium 210820-DFI.6.37]|nr:hypothetical protein [bacterium 210820-DFI.6.37]